MLQSVVRTLSFTYQARLPTGKGIPFNWQPLSAGGQTASGFKMEEVNFDDLCELAARAGNAPAAVITRLDAANNLLEVIGRFGTAKSYKSTTALPLLDPDSAPIIAIPDVSREPAFDGHPIRTFTPPIRSLIAAILKSKSRMERTTLTILNPSPDLINNAERFACISKLVLVYRQLLNSIELNERAAVPPELLKLSPGGFQEDARVTAGPAGTFLLDTLLHRQALRSRNGASFVTLRSWRRSIKEHQISALVAIKKTPPAQFVNAAADDIVQAVNHLYGKQLIGAVVPVPGGSSGEEESLSVRIADEVSARLGIPNIKALRGQPVAQGASHPRKSQKLKPYEVFEKVPGTVLVVDDVATSGKHIELAQKALRNAGSSCLAIAWIGG